MPRPYGDDDDRGGERGIFVILCVCKNESLLYQAYHLLKAFYPAETIDRKVSGGDRSEMADLFVRLPDGYEIRAAVKAGSESSDPVSVLYRQIVSRTGRTLAWGKLTGVRPIKLAMELLEEVEKEKGKMAGDGDAVENAKAEGEAVSAEAARRMEEKYCVSPQKARLAVSVAQRERDLLSRLAPDGVSLYVGIPFCPSICSYCSFGSALADRWIGQMDDYVDALLREQDALVPYVRERRLQTIYVGGGTPTTLSAQQQERLYDGILARFSMDDLLEFTVEAGRPDAIDKEKLSVIRRFPVSRISINPQTMNDWTLAGVGRGHTAADVLRAYELAREIGFTNINMDLIAGLPGEDETDMSRTLDRIGAMDPESVTVHALAIKRAARYGIEGRTADLSKRIGAMVDRAAAFCLDHGYAPYYLYRQKNIAGNFENTGYAKEGADCLYNILIMEERQTILAVGAKATTKVVLPHKVSLPGGRQTHLLRHENVKDIRSYMERVQDMIDKKGELL